MSLEQIGQLAIDLHVAASARKLAKHELRERYAEFCLKSGLGADALISNTHPLYPVMQEFAAEQVEAYKRAKLDEYNLKRKLERAIRSPKRKATLPAMQGVPSGVSRKMAHGDAVQGGAV